MQVIKSSFYLRRVEYTCHYKNINKVAVQNKNVMFFLTLANMIFTREFMRVKLLSISFHQAL